MAEESNVLSRFWVRKGNLVRVQVVAAVTRHRDIFTRGSQRIAALLVEWIPHERMASGCEMNPDLVGPSRD